MKDTEEALALLDQRLALQLRSQRTRALAPPAELDERALRWLALAPLWTPRLASACGFPDERIGSNDRSSLRRLERLYREVADDDQAGKAAIRQAEGLIEFRRGRLDRAALLLREALAGHERVGSHSAAVAACFYLGEIARMNMGSGDPVAWFERAVTEEATWGDDVGRAFLTGCVDQLQGERSSTATPPAAVPLRGEFLETARILDRIASLGLCETVVGDAADSEIGQRLTERRYWMNDLVRDQVVRQVTDDDSARGLPAIQHEVALIGQRMLDAATNGVPVLPTVLTWAKLAALANDIGAVADRLASECDRLLSSGPVDDPNPSGTALAWIRAAAPLEQLLKGELTITIDRVRRRLDLFHRRLDDDQRYLTHFVARKDQLAAIDDLLADDDAWALHFVGVGGTGKTMLMRYISSRLGPARHASTARIDFDYLNPDYPAQQPGLLLDALAGELRLSAEGEALSAFAQFDEKLQVLDEKGSAAGRGIAGPVSSGISADDVRARFAETLQAFARALDALPRPVILLIDTCEELAKVRPDGRSPEGVRRTFEILNELRGKVSRLKVIFAGRRPLARSGAGWELRDDSELPDRPELRLHEIKGFSEREALDYLESEDVPELLRSPILTQARDRSDAERFTWTDSERSPAKVPRYSPFELSGWAALARQRAGENLSPDDIEAADADRYIELRVIRRIKYDPLVQALPALGLLGHFDSALLRTVAPPSPEFDVMFTELRQQEWIHRRSIDVYAVDEALRRRLIAHYERVSPHEVERCYRLAAEHLEQRTLENPLDELLPFHFDTAMRVLRREPGRAARWWARVEARFAEEGEYDWARQLAEFMLGPEGACPELDRFGGRPAEAAALRAGVLATQLACFTHTGQHADWAGGWADVQTLLASYPDETARQALEYRAKVGQLATSSHSQDGAARVIVALDQLLGARPPAEYQLVASLIAAVEECVERAEAIHKRHVADWDLSIAETVSAAMRSFDPHIADWFPPDAPDLAAFSYSLAGRLAVLGGRYTEAEQFFRQSLDLAPVPGNPELDADGSADRASRWLDWQPPANLEARLRLELIRGLYPAALSVQAVLQLIGPDTNVDPVTVDEERLASAELMLSCANGLPDNKWWGLRSQALAEQTGRFRPERNCHRAFPSLAISQAEAKAAMGQVDQALELLGAIGRTSERTGSELDSVIDAVRAELRIVRRMRLRDEGRGVGGDLAGSMSLADRELLWSLDGLDGAKAAARQKAVPIELGPLPEGANVLPWVHARWRTLSRLAWSPKAMTEFARSLWPELGVSELDRQAVILDQVEASLLNLLPRDSVALPSNTDNWSDYPDQPEPVLRLMLRTAVLNPAAPRAINVPDSLILRLGRRRAALIALDEGEMLGLRLPDRSLPIVELARQWLFECRDYVGAFIARTLFVVLQARTGVRPSAGYFENTWTDLKLLSFLPPWSELKEVIDSPTGAALDVLTPRDWRPWLVRIIACYTWSRSTRKRPANLRAMQNWIELNFGELQKNPPDSLLVAVPAELDGWLGGFAPETATRDTWRGLDFWDGIRVSWRQVRELRRQGKPYLSTIYRGILAPGFILLYTFLAAPLLVASATFGFVSFTSKWFPLIFVGAYIVGWAMAGASVMLFLAIVRRLSRDYSTSLSGASPARRAILGTVLVSPDLVSDSSWTELRLESSRGRLLADERILPSSVEGSYSASFPAKLAQALVKLASSRSSRTVIELQLEPGFAAPCWEAMIAGSARRARVVRTLTSRRLRPVKAWRDIRSAVSVAADLSQETMASQGWSRLSRRRRYQHEIWRPEDVFAPDPPAEAIDIVHLLGTPINTASGPRLDLGRIVGDQPRGRRGGSARGELVQPADVVSRFPDVVCCVLQATPQDHTLRTDAEREQAATLRVIAEEIFSRGIPAVITIPALPSDTAANVLDQISEAVLTRPQQMVPALTEAIHHAQQQVAKVAGISPEVAMDICVYAGAGK